MTADKQETRDSIGQIREWIGGKTSVWTVIAVALGYLAISIVMTWPLITELTTHTPAGYGGDVWAHHWTYWWVKTAISQGSNPFFTDLLYYPEGVSLTTHNIPWFNIAVWIPLQAIIGGLAAFGLIYILAFAFNGFAMFLLLREYTERTAAAFIGGLIFGAWPFVLSQWGHPNTIIIGWVPLALLMLKRTMERGRLRDAVAAGVFLALTGIVRWQLLIMAGIAIGLFIIHKLVTDHACRTRRTVLLLLLAGLVSVLLMSPLLLPVVGDVISRESIDPILKTRLDLSSDLLAYVVPNHRLWLYGDLVQQLPDSLNFSHDTVEFMGIVTLLLLVIGIIKGGRSAWLWVVIFLSYLALALGPNLTIAHQTYPGVPMPYRLVQDFILVEIVRYPARYNVFLGLPVAMLAGLGVSSLLRHPRLGQRPTMLVLLLAVLIGAEYWLMPYRTLPYGVPDWYDQLAQEPGDFALLDLPMDQGGADKNYMFFQTTHGRPLVEGHVSRLPLEAEGFINSDPFLKRLAADGTMDPSIPMLHELGQLSDAGIRYLILHKGRASAEALEQWQEWLALEPYHEDDDLIVYRTDPDLVSEMPVGRNVTEALQISNTHYGPEEISTTNPIYISSRWASTKEMEQDYDLCYRLVDQSGQIFQEQCQRLGGTWPTSEWIVGERVLGYEAMRINAFLEPATYQLSAAVVDSETGSSVGQQIDLGPVIVRSNPRTFDVPEDIERVDALWEDKISLPGYALQQADDYLELTLYWQALDRMDSSYKFFVHLVDEASGDVVTQDDAVPRRWSYPTDWWERGEVVEDTILLSLEDVAPGKYRLFVGWYDPTSGARLQATSTEGEPYPDNSVLLTTWQRD